MVDMVTWQRGGETGYGRHGYLVTWWRDRTWSTWSPGNRVERQDMVDMVTWQPGGETARTFDLMGRNTNWSYDHMVYLFWYI